MPHRGRFLDPKQKATLAEIETQLPNLHFEVYSDAFLALKYNPKLCVVLPLSWLHREPDKVVFDILKETQFKS